MVLEFIKDLFHLKSRQNGFNENGGPYGTIVNSHMILGELEGVIPETRVEMTFHLGQVEIRTALAVQKLVSIVKEVEAKIKKACAHGLIIDPKVGFLEMPAPRAHHESCCRIVQAVLLAIGIPELKCLSHRCH